MTSLGPMFTMGTGAAANELVRPGQMDVFLKKSESTESVVTYWRRRFVKTTNFAMENVVQAFQTPPKFGHTSQLTFQHVADLLYYVYIVIDLPAIKAHLPGITPMPVLHDDNNNASGYATMMGQNTAFGVANTDTPIAVAGSSSLLPQQYVSQESNPAVWCHWANAVAQLIVKRAALFIDGHLTDTLYGVSLYMWEELSGKAGKRLREMIGKRKTREQLIKDAKHKQRFYVPLPYFFTLNPGSVLPIGHLKNSVHGVQLMVEWESLANCIVVSHKNVQVLKADNSPLTENDLKAHVDATYVHLDDDERTRFETSNFDQLITQTQLNYFTGKSEVHQVNLSFNHPVIELMWAVRRKEHETVNNWFNFSGKDGRDPVEEVALKINNRYRFGGQEGRYYRLVEPYQSHSSIPKSHIYSKSFAIAPEAHDPCGSSDFSNVDSAELILKLQPELKDEDVTIIIVARNHQIVRYNKGKAGPLFRD